MRWRALGPSGGDASCGILGHCRLPSIGLRTSPVPSGVWCHVFPRHGLQIFKLFLTRLTRSRRIVRPWLRPRRRLVSEAANHSYLLGSQGKYLGTDCEAFDGSLVICLRRIRTLANLSLNSRYVNAQTSPTQMPLSTGPNDLPSFDAKSPTDLACPCFSLFYFPYPCSRFDFSVGLTGKNAWGCQLIRRLFKLQI